MAEILSYNHYRDMHNDVQLSAMFFGKNIQNIPFFSSTQTAVKEFDSYGLKVFTFTGKERDSETGFSYFGARYYDSNILTGWLSVDPMADKYPNISPYAYCAWNPVKLVDPDGEDWYESDGGAAIWKKGNSKEIIQNGIKYRNIGQYYTKVEGNILTHYNQNKIQGKTDLDSDIGKKFSMLAAEGGWIKDKETQKTARETQYGLYIIGASMENRLNNPKFFPNNGTYESLFNPKQYNAAKSNVYINLPSVLDQWKEWYGTKDVMDYLNAVYNAAHNSCVNILIKQYDFQEANMILGYAHKKSNLFGKYSINLNFDRKNTLIKTVQSSTNVFTRK